MTDLVTLRLNWILEIVVFERTVYALEDVRGNFQLLFNIIKYYCLKTLKNLLEKVVQKERIFLTQLDF